MNLFRTSAETACTVRVNYLLNLQVANPTDMSPNPCTVSGLEL